MKLCKAITYYSQSKTNTLKIKNVSHNKKCNWNAVQVHVDPPLIPLSKGKNYGIPVKSCVKIKLCRHPTSQKSDLHGFKMVVFYNGGPEEFLLFIRKFNMTLEASEKLADNVKIQYPCTILHGELLRQFGTLSAEVGGTTS